MDEPPFIVDGARVVAYAHLDPPSIGAHRSTVVAGGVPLESAAGLMIAENLADGAVFLLFCDDDWQTLAVEQHADAEAAEGRAKALFPEVGETLKRYRPLSAGEQAEVESTRSFLRDLARDFPA